MIYCCLYNCLIKSFNVVMKVTKTETSSTYSFFRPEEWWCLNSYSALYRKADVPSIWEKKSRNLGDFSIRSLRKPDVLVTWEKKKQIFGRFQCEKSKEKCPNCNFFFRDKAFTSFYRFAYVCFREYTKTS
jgi:hypothetical protein